MKQQSLNEIQDIYKNNLNNNVINIIYSYYYKKPKFKKVDLVLHKIGSGRHVVRIYKCYLDMYDHIKGHYYNYDYYPSSEGYSY